MKSPQMSSKSGGKALCSVCGDESSGFHYGVDSCEGCKGFFRRCITQGMNHKCTNEEKCEITPFTRNSCQYCRLKKCFEVGMSREASRLGRRPKRMKEVGGEGSGGSRVGNLPIAPYPAPQDMNRMRMEDLQKVLHTTGSIKDDLMQALLTVAKASFQEHSKTGDKGKSQEVHQELKTTAVVPSPSQTLMSVASGIPTTSSLLDTHSVSVDNGGQRGGGRIDVDSPSSLNSPGGSSMTDLNLVALDSFLFEQGMPTTPGGSQQILLDGVGDLQVLNSPNNSSTLGLDSASSATSPVSDFGVGSPVIMPSSSSSVVTNGRGVLVSDSSHLQSAGDLSHLSLAGGPQSSAMLLPPTPSVQNSTVPSLQTPSLLPSHQYLAQPVCSSQSMTSPSVCKSEVKQEIKTEPKTEPGVSCSTSCSVKKEPVSPVTTTPMRYPLLPIRPRILDDMSGLPAVNVKAIFEEVRQVPSGNRRLLIEQVTDAVVNAHINTTLNTHKAIEEANMRIQVDFGVEATHDPEKVKAQADYMWQQFVSCMVPEITNVVKFCKKLPGFVEIEQDDQIRLIKQGAFEIMMTRFALLVDVENQTLLDPTLTSRCPRHVILATPMGGFLDEFFYVAARFKPLKLTDGEVGLFTSILIVCPSRKGLKNKVAIGKIQSLFLQALYILMKHNHPDADERFRNLMELITTFRRINDEHFKAINDIRLTFPSSAKFPELHREIFDNSD